MNGIEIATGIVLYDNVIDDYKNIINEVEKAASSKIVPWRISGVRSEEVDEKYKNNKTLTIGIPYAPKNKENIDKPSYIFYSKMRDIFLNAFDPFEKDYSQHFKVKTLSHEYYAILKYGIGQNFSNHIDDHHLFERRISTVYYLNDDYVGGEIIFPRFNIKLKPKANQMIIFPSTYVYNHSVAPITEGIRYSVASWLK